MIHRRQCVREPIYILKPRYTLILQRLSYIFSFFPRDESCYTARGVLCISEGQPSAGIQRLRSNSGVESQETKTEYLGDLAWCREEVEVHDVVNDANKLT